MGRASYRALALLMAAATLLSCGPQPPEHQLVEPSGPSLRLPRALFAGDEVRFFTFLHDGARVNFLVRADDDGTLQAHLDACYGCYRYKMGYVVEARDLVCRACRLRYPIGDPHWDFIGACAPITLPSTLDGDDLVIETAVLERAARYF